MATVLNVTVTHPSGGEAVSRQYESADFIGAGFDLLRDLTFSQDQDDGLVYSVKKTELPSGDKFGLLLRHKLLRRSNFKIVD